MVADETSEVIDISYIDGYGGVINWTSTTCVATIKFQESYDNINWEDVSSGSQAVSNNSGSTNFTFTGVMAPYLRVLVDWTSGSLTTVDVTIHAKSV